MAWHFKFQIQADEQDSIDELNRTQEALDILKEVGEDINQEQEETPEEKALEEQPCGSA